MYLKKRVVSAEETASKAQAELDTAEAKLTLMDGEPVLGENPVRMKRLKSSAEKTKEEEVSVRESLEAKEALLARALDEIEVLTAYILLFVSINSLLQEMNLLFGNLYNTSNRLRIASVSPKEEIYLFEFCQGP